MHLMDKLFVVNIFGFLIFEVTCTLQCCENNATIIEWKKCSDGTKINITCNEDLILLDPGRPGGDDDTFAVGEDAQGEYLDTFIIGYIVREPHFCLGRMQFNSPNRTANVAIACSAHPDGNNDQNSSQSIGFEREWKIIRLYNELAFILNWASVLTFSIIAIIYYFLPEVQDLQGTCYFHLTFLGGLGHATIAYLEMSNSNTALPDSMCTVEVYLTVYFLVSGFMWMGIVCYNTWRHTRNIHVENETKFLRKCKLFAYGIPLILLVSQLIHVHVVQGSGFTFNQKCNHHQMTAYEIYAAISILLTILINLIMFIHTQILIWNWNATSSFKLIKHRLIINAKLFFVMGIPWALYIILVRISVHTGIYHDQYAKHAQECFELLLYGEGVPIFIILVLFRKRVIRGMAKTWLCSIFPNKWRTIRDSETGEEDEEKVENANTNTQVRYDPQKADMRANQSAIRFQ